MRLPDEIIWSWPWMSFCVGHTYQKYFLGAFTLTICIGILTLRWHWR